MHARSRDMGTSHARDPSLIGVQAHLLDGRREGDGICGRESQAEGGQDESMTHGCSWRLFSGYGFSRWLFRKFKKGS